MSALDRVLPCRPQKVIMGMSAETFWDGLAGSKEFQQRCEERAGVSIAMGSDACQAALRRYGSIKRISVITPYMPIGDENVRKFFTDCGFEVVQVKGFKCKSPMQIAHVSEKELRDAIIEVNDGSVESLHWSLIGPGFGSREADHPRNGQDKHDAIVGLIQIA
jgi:maleate isomerase